MSRWLASLKEQRSEECRITNLCLHSVNITPDRSLKLGWEPVFGEDFILESIKKDAAVIWRESQESNRSPSGGVDGET